VATSLLMIAIFLAVSWLIGNWLRPPVVIGMPRKSRRKPNCYPGKNSDQRQKNTVP